MRDKAPAQTKGGGLSVFPTNKPRSVMSLSVEQVARVAHEANRAYQIITGDPVVSPEWDAAPQSQRDSAIEGVNRVLAGDTPEQLHESWCDFKREQGWTYGETKDEAAKTHPCLVAYDALPEEQKVKDLLFNSVVEALLDPEDQQARAARAAAEFIEEVLVEAKESHGLEVEHTTEFHPEENLLVLTLHNGKAFTRPCISLADATPGYLTALVWQSLFVVYTHKEQSS